jgi:SanA protein
MQKKKIKIIIRITLTAIIVGILFSVGVNYGVRTFSAQYIVSDIGKVSHTRVALVLGASVASDGTLMPALHDRALTAVELYKSAKIERILVSGDNGSRYYNEVEPTKKFLIDAGVPAEKIYLDYAGFDTYDSMFRAFTLFGVKEAVIITQGFHLPRAVYIARSLGIDATGMVADKRAYAWKNSFIEYFATIKAFFDVVFQSKSKYGGAKIIIR